jgi:hypothetical protein
MNEIHGSKNALLEFMDLSDINYKFMNKNALFRVYGLFSKFIDLSDTNYKLMDLKMPLLEFVDLNGTSLQVDGPLMHFTLTTTTTYSSAYIVVVMSMSPSSSLLYQHAQRIYSLV